MYRTVVCAIALLVLAACSATPYQPNELFGGYSEEMIGPDVYRVKFVGNNDTSFDTAQTYWFYRASELTLENGFDGFEMMTLARVGQRSTPTDESPYRHVAMIFVPSPRITAPTLISDIRLIKAPVPVRPPKVFDARALHEALAPWVNADRKCSGGNLCSNMKGLLEPLKPDNGPSPAPSLSPSLSPTPT